MILLWLIIWLICGVPALHEWNAWAVTLIICAALTVLQGGYTASK